MAPKRKVPGPAAPPPAPPQPRWLWPGVVAVLFLFLLKGRNTYHHFPDGAGYLAYLPSLLSDGDLEFSNEFARLQMPPPNARTASGYTANLWPSGSALLWLPFYGSAWILALLRTPGPAGPDPLSPALVASANFGSLACGLGAALLAGVSLRRVLGLGPGTSWAASAAALLGTPAGYYAFFLANTSHGPSALAASLLLSVWVGFWCGEAPPTRRGWLLLGALSGLCASVRTQDGLFLLAPAVLLARGALRAEGTRERARIALRGGALLGAGLLLGMAAEILLWKIVYGSWFAAPQAFNLEGAEFLLGEVLFSPFHGLFSWTPIFAVALAGLALAPAERRGLAGVLALLWAGVWLVVGRSAGWFGGYSFGARHFTSCLWIAAVGCGWLLARFPRTGGAALAASAAWTVGLALAARSGGLSLDNPVGWGDLFRASISGWAALPAQAAFLASRPRLDAPLALVLAAVAAGGGRFLHGLASAGPEAGARKAGRALALGLGLFAALSIRAHLRRPPENPASPGVSLEALQRFIHRLDWETQARYFRSTGDLPRALRAEERARRLMP